MSKKKPFSGSTMSLRDFHGGSIPSDLPLPSAPGKTPERSSSFDRQNSGGWVNNASVGRERSGLFRPSSGNGVRSLEDKALSFLPNPANIGRNYEEDERKPVDSHLKQRGGYADRQTLSDNRSLDGGSNISRPRSAPYPESRTFDDFKTTSSSAVVYNQNTSSSFSRGSALELRLEDRPEYYHSRQISPTPQSPHNTIVTSSLVPNVWTARHEGRTARPSPVETSPSDGTSVGWRFAQASAVDKVSSGRWSSRLFIDPPQELTNQAPQSPEHPYGTPQSSSIPDIYTGGGSSDIIDRRRGFSDTNRDSYTDGERGGESEKISRYGEGDLGYGSSSKKQGALYLDSNRASVVKGGGVSDVEAEIYETQSSYGLSALRGEFFEGGNRRSPYQGHRALSSEVSSLHYDIGGAESPQNSVRRDLHSSDDVKSPQPISGDANTERSSSSYGNISQKQELLQGLTTGKVDSNPILDVKGSHNERPKLKLLPRTKPLETSAAEAFSPKDQPKVEAVPRKLLSPSGTGGVLISKIITRPQVAESSEEPNRPAERPKLVLKPRTEVAVNVASEKERKSIFGGARPREVVLKERGIDDIVLEVNESTVVTPGSVHHRPSSGGGARSNLTELADHYDVKVNNSRRHELVENGNTKLLERQESGRIARKQNVHELDTTGNSKLLERQDSRQRSNVHFENRHTLDRKDSNRQEERWRRSSEPSSNASFGPASLGGIVSHNGPHLSSPSLKEVPFSRLVEAPLRSPGQVFASGLAGGYNK